MNEQEYTEHVKTAILAQNPSAIPAPNSNGEFRILLEALVEEADKLNKLVTKNGDDLAIIHGCKKPKVEEVLPHGVTTNAKSPFWALGAIYHNPNLKD